MVEGDGEGKGWRVFFFCGIFPPYFLLIPTNYCNMY
jgi:hypothetical protein